MTKPGRRNSHAAPKFTGEGIRCAFAACLLAAWAAAGGLQAQVVKVIEKDLGAGGAVSLALLGPANWEEISTNDSRVTRLGFVETKTGRVILDLGERGFNGFTGKSPVPMLEARVSPDRARVAVVLQWKHNGDWAAFEIKEKMVRELKLERADGRAVIRERCTNIRPEGGFSRNITVSAGWEGNEVLRIDESGDFGFKGEEPGQTHDVALRSIYDVKNGKGSPAKTSLLVDGKERHAVTGDAKGAGKK